MGRGRGELHPFPASVIQEACGIHLPLETIERPVQVNGFSIGRNTREIDRTIWLDKVENGYIVRVSLLDVGAILSSSRNAASIIDEARKRAFATSYPDGRYDPLFPQTISEEALSFVEGEERPAITVSIHLDESFRQVDGEDPLIELTRVTNRKSLTYGMVDHEMHMRDSANGQLLMQYFAVAQGLINQRRANGAIAFYDLTQGFYTKENGGLVDMRNAQMHMSDLIVREFTTLANTALANFMLGNMIPGFYTTQHAAPTARQTAFYAGGIEELVKAPHLFNIGEFAERLRMSFGPVRYSDSPELGHYALNLHAYTRMDQPAHRFPDFVNVANVGAYLRGADFDYERDQIAEMTDGINARIAEIGIEQKTVGKEAAERTARRTVFAQAADALESLNSTLFYSAICQAAVPGLLDRTPHVAQAIIARLNAEPSKLTPKDLLAILSLPQEREGLWNVIHREVVDYLLEHPFHAISILNTAKQNADLKITGQVAGRTQGVIKGRNTYTISIQVSRDGQGYLSDPITRFSLDQAEQFATLQALLRAFNINITPEQIARFGFTSSPVMQESKRVFPWEDAEKRTGKGIKALLNELCHENGAGQPLYFEENEEGRLVVYAVATVGGKDIWSDPISIEGESVRNHEKAAAWNLYQIIIQMPLVQNGEAIEGIIAPPLDISPTPVVAIKENEPYPWDLYREQHEGVDIKTALQQFCQAQGWTTPTYQSEGSFPTFRVTVRVFIDGQPRESVVEMTDVRRQIVEMAAAWELHEKIRRLAVDRSIVAPTPQTSAQPTRERRTQVTTPAARVISTEGWDEQSARVYRLGEIPEPTIELPLSNLEGVVYSLAQRSGFRKPSVNLVSAKKRGLDDKGQVCELQLYHPELRKALVVRVVGVDSIQLKHAAFQIAYELLRGM